LEGYGPSGVIDHGGYGPLEGSFPSGGCGISHGGDYDLEGGCGPCPEGGYDDQGNGLAPVRRHRRLETLVIHVDRSDHWDRSDQGIVAGHHLLLCLRAEYPHLLLSHRQSDRMPG